jgi:hypothetical protein
LRARLPVNPQCVGNVSRGKHPPSTTIQKSESAEALSAYREPPCMPALEPRVARSQGTIATGSKNAA